ncbi:hypothetical protein [Campylobacter insulaenigrae]|uniref:Uncharacterized protein n=1 Tax=Campylobacter insulaenigrae TaxID=260714 RepID=A0ABY3G3Q1_9BACT|nr:hypothetical protein [Campylobacter insulaenigrae]TWO25891.1 hypothetical protein ZA01_03590 [Campylobacter insulaenigrae]
MSFISTNTQKNTDLDKIIKYLDDFDLDDFKNNVLIKLLLACFLDQLRFTLGKIYVIQALDENMRLEKTRVWIQSHLEYFNLICINLEYLNSLILKNKIFIENELIQNKLEKYIQK